MKAQLTIWHEHTQCGEPDEHLYLDPCAIESILFCEKRRAFEGPSRVMVVRTLSGDVHTVRRDDTFVREVASAWNPAEKTHD